MLPLLPGTCAVELRPTVPGAVANLGIAELELYDLRGARIPSSSLYYSISSTFDTSGTWDAKNCFDGNLATNCNAAANSINPTLKARYPCPSGSTSLSRVVVQNRQDCCQASLNGFSLYYFNSLGVADSPSFSITGSLLTYTSSFPVNARKDHEMPALDWRAGMGPGTSGRCNAVLPNTDQLLLS